jgi:hypothetical protein
MFKWFDRVVEKVLYNRFEKNRTQMKEKPLKKVLKENPDLTRAEFNELCNRIAKEEIRVYPIVDRALLRAGIIRAKYNFLLVGITSTLIIGSLGGFSSNSVLPFISPLATAFFAMANTLITIEIPYKQRAKAAYESVIKVYSHERKPDPSFNASLQAMRALFDVRPQSTPRLILNSSSDEIIIPVAPPKADEQKQEEANSLSISP